MLSPREGSSSDSVGAGVKGSKGAGVGGRTGAGVKGCTGAGVDLVKEGAMLGSADAIENGDPLGKKVGSFV